MASRSREFALRVALGARRRQVLGQVLVESVGLALCGGVAGVALAYVGTPVLLAQGPRDVQLLADVRPGSYVLVVSTLAGLATGIVCGVLPAWQVLRTDPRSILQEGSRSVIGGDRPARTRHWLVGLEMALSTALLASAALLLHSFVNTHQADRGYAVERVLTIDLTPGGQRYSSAAARVTYYRELLDKISSVPEVLVAGAISAIPALAESSTQTVYLPTDIETPELTLRRPVAGIRSATPGYFAASGTAWRAGRVFGTSEPAPVAVISESLGQQLWPGETAANMVGRSIAQGAATDPPSLVVGVVADVRSGDLGRELPPQLYRPHQQVPTAWMTAVVRTARDPAALVASVRDTVRQHDPTVPIVAARTMREIVAASLDRRRFQMSLTLSFGVVALLLGAVGVYGVVSYSVVRQTRNIGVRIALGASPRTILRQTVSEGMQPAVVGLGAGLLGAVALAQVLQHLLFGIGPLDHVALGSVTLLLLTTAALACDVPARRASRLDPITALRRG